MNNIDKFLSSMFLFGSYSSDTLEDMIMCSLNEELMNIRLTLTIEVIELYEEKNYSYEEIINMIDNVNLKNNYKLTDKEEDYLKRDAKKVLDIRRNLRNEGKRKEMIKNE